jgi:integrase
VGRQKGAGYIGRKPWRGRTFRGYWTDDTGKRHWVYGKSRTDVEKAITAAINDYSKGLNPDASTMTVGEYLGSWLKDKKVTINHSTWMRYEELGRLHIVPLLGGQRIRQPLVGKLRRAQTVLLSPRTEGGGHELSPRTVIQVRAILHGMFAAAMADGTLSRERGNPLDAVQEPRVDSPDPVAIDDEVVHLLLRTAREHQPRWHALYALLAVTGCDIGRALAARRGDLDLENGVLYTGRSLRKMSGVGYVEGAPKRKQRKHFLELDEALCVILAAHLDLLDSERAAATATGTPWADETADLLFPREDGYYKDPRTITNHHWQKLLKAAELARRSLKIKDFRSTTVTVLVEEGTPEPLVQKMIGHSLRTETMRRHYLATRSTVTRAAASRVAGRLLPPVSTGTGERRGTTQP